MTQEDATAAHGAVKFVAKVGGTDVTSRIVSCRVVCGLGAIDWFELRFDTWLAQQEAENRKAVQHGGDHLGKAVELTFTGGSGSFQEKETVAFTYRGVVTEVGFHVDHDGPDQTVVVGHGPMWKLANAAHFTTFKDPVLSKVVKTVVEAHSEKVSFKAQTDHKLRYVVQHGDGDLDFLWRTCRQVGEWFFYDGKDLVVGWSGDHGGKPVSLQWGEGLRTCRAEARVVPLHYQANVYHYPTSKDLKKDSASPTNVAASGDSSKLRERALQASGEVLKKGGVAVGGTFAVDKDVEQAVKARTDNAASRALTFWGRTSSSPLMPGRRLTVRGVGALDGEYRAIEVSHSFSVRGGYQCDFVALPSSVRHPALPEHPPQAASLQMGVVEDNADPDKLGRVRVRLKWNTDAKKDDLPWIRVVHHHAGKNHGAYFLPELGDEVLVGHEFDDPDRPIVLGSLYHGQAKPKSDVVDDKNDVKEFHTRSGNTVRITDKDGKEEIAVSTPKESNQIVMTAGSSPKILVKTKGAIRIEAAKTIEIEAGEKMTLTSPKIELKAKDMAQIDAGTIEAKAKDKAKFSAPTIEHAAQNEHKLTAGSKLAASAATVELSAQASLKASSGAVAEVSGGATLTVKAPLVRIN